jgi:hypothetical protein
MNNLLKAFLIIIVGIGVQGCSWYNFFQLRNTTNSIWKIKYEIINERGVLTKKISIKNKSKVIRTKEFKNNYVEFDLAPKEVAILGYSRNSYYQGYKNSINAKNLVISNEQTNVEIEFSKLDEVLDKNSRQVAQISISKLIKNNKKSNP